MDFFVKKVQQMRLKQRQYFRTRSQADLVEVEKIESEVDKLVADYIKAKHQQPTLF